MSSIQIRQILFSTDFSAPSRHALEYAVALTEKFGAELHVLHVVEEPTLPVHGSKYAWAVGDDIVPKIVDQAKLELALAVPEHHLLAIDRRLVREIRVGHPVTEIVNYAEQKEMDLIVIGTHGRSGISHLLLGSVAEKVVRLAKCPVFSIHPPAATRTKELHSESSKQDPKR